MKIPYITHQQALVLARLEPKMLSGEMLRLQLLPLLSIEGPAFYQMMARLEKAQLVSGRYKEKKVGKQRIRERFYKIRKLGITQLKVSRDFYNEIS